MNNRYYFKRIYVFCVTHNKNIMSNINRKNSINKITKNKTKLRKNYKKVKNIKRN